MRLRDEIAAALAWVKESERSRGLFIGLNGTDAIVIDSVLAIVVETDRKKADLFRKEWNAMLRQIVHDYAITKGYDVSRREICERVAMRVYTNRSLLVRKQRRMRAMAKETARVARSNPRAQPPIDPTDPPLLQLMKRTS